MTTIWLAAAYHFPSTYSCRIPMSSMSNALAMPAPGPATVRLALIRRGIELFGMHIVRDEIFPTVRAMPIQIQPPEKVALFHQHLRGYKWDAGKAGKNDTIQESIMTRETAQATGTMTIYIQIPVQDEERYQLLLRNIGYWGQTSSIAYCIGIEHTAPEPGMYALPLDSLVDNQRLQPFFSCLVSEFRDNQVTWEEIQPILHVNRTYALQLDIYVWPMVVCYQQVNSKTLVRHSLLEREDP